MIVIGKGTCSHCEVHVPISVTYGHYYNGHMEPKNLERFWTLAMSKVLLYLANLQSGPLN